MWGKSETAEGIDRIRKALTKHSRYSAATKLRRQQYRQVVFGPYFKGKLEVIESLREPTGAENSPTRRPRGSSSAPTEAERGSPFAAAAGDARALTSLDSSRLESSHYPSRQWNPSKETAASLVAEGQLPIREIAQRVGVSEKTIDRWKQRPAFLARVDEILANFRKQLIPCCPWGLRKLVGQPRCFTRSEQRGRRRPRQSRRTPSERPKTDKTHAKRAHHEKPRAFRGILGPGSVVNHPNFAQPAANISSPGTVGQITSTFGKAPQHLLRLGEIGSQFHCGFDLPPRFVKPATASECDSIAVVCQSIGGSQGNSLPEMEFCCGEIALGSKHVAQIAVSRSEVGLQPDRFTK